MHKIEVGNVYQDENTSYKGKKACHTVVILKILHNYEKDKDLIFVKETIEDPKTGRSIASISRYTNPTYEASYFKIQLPIDEYKYEDKIKELLDNYRKEKELELEKYKKYL